MCADFIEDLLQQWARERPDLDASPMAIIGRISRAARTLERSQEEVFAQMGLPPGGFDVLAALRRSGEPYCLSPTELYNSCLVSSGAMTNRLDRLRRLGLVERIAGAKDRRSLLVRLTPAGLEKIDQAIVAHLENEHKLVAALEPRDRDSLARILQRWLIELDDRPVERRRDLYPTGHRDGVDSVL